MNVTPDFGGLDGLTDLETVIGALLMFVLVTAVLMLIVSALVWAIAAAIGHVTAASKAKAGVLVALGAAALGGCGIAWMNWLISIGQQL